MCTEVFPCLEQKEKVIKYGSGGALVQSLGLSWKMKVAVFIALPLILGLRCSVLWFSFPPMRCQCEMLSVIFRLHEAELGGEHCACRVRPNVLREE